MALPPNKVPEYPMVAIDVSLSDEARKVVAVLECRTGIITLNADHIISFAEKLRAGLAGMKIACKETAEKMREMSAEMEAIRYKDPPPPASRLSRIAELHRKEMLKG
jgi:hypothetical protein